MVIFWKIFLAFTYKTRTVSSWSITTETGMFTRGRKLNLTLIVGESWVSQLLEWANISSMLVFILSQKIHDHRRRHHPTTATTTTNNHHHLLPMTFHSLAARSRLKRTSWKIILCTRPLPSAMGCNLPTVCFHNCYCKMNGVTIWVQYGKKYSKYEQYVGWF